MLLGTPNKSRMSRVIIDVIWKPNKQRMSRVIIDVIRKTKQTENVSCYY